MDEASIELEKWIATVDEYTPTSWDRLPELELYMDQVLTFMNRQLEPFSPDGKQLLTPSMINNYVKDGVLPRPVKKKYSRVHLGMLMIICSLKSVLSLPEISSLMKGLALNKEIFDQFPTFVQAHGTAMKEATSRITDMGEKDDESLCKLALQLSLEANARRIAAARILKSLSECQPEKEKSKKD